MVISKVTMCLTGAVSMLSRPPGPCKYSAAIDELLADTAGKVLGFYTMFGHLL